MTYIAEPIQRTELRSLAKIIRKILQVEDKLYIPVILVLENDVVAHPFHSVNRQIKQNIIS